MLDQQVTFEPPTEIPTPLELYLSAFAPPGNENAAPFADGSGANLDTKPAKVSKPEYKKAGNRSIRDLLGDVSDIASRGDATRIEARRLDFFHNGYRPIPTIGKRPNLNAWQTTVADEMDVRRWTRSHSKATNTGIVLGENLVAIDVDVTDAAVAAELVSLAKTLTDTPPLVRWGNAPKTLLLFRTDEPISKCTTAKYRRPGDDKDQAVEVLGAGQQFIADGIHPIGRDYTWEGDSSPANVALDDLPLITPAIVRGYLENADAILSKTKWSKSKDSTRDKAEPDLFDDLTGDLDEPYDQLSPDRCREILDDLPPSWVEDRDLWFRAIGAIHDNFLGSKEGFELARIWSKQSEKFDSSDFRRDWLSLKKKPHGVTMGTLIQAAADHRHKTDLDADIVDLGDSDEPEPVEKKTSKLTFLTPADCAAMPSRGYVIKGFIAPGDVGCIFGEPGAGKSMIAPYLGYMVSRGKEAFGMRSKQGKVFYLPAEDESGMQMRVRALHEQYGDADDFFVVRGAHIAEVDALKDLLREVKRQKPSLIVIDTLAASFPGLEENSSEAMSRVVRVGKRLAAFGAAVLFIHHSTKDANGTPRGHSVLNGALDVSMELFKADDDGIVRGRLKKNRNGPCDRNIAFSIQSHVFGFDEDGDVVTAGYCEPRVGQAAKKRIHLNPPQKEALAILRDKLGHVPDKSLGVPIDDWRKACRGSPKICASDNPETVRKAVQRAFEGLFRMGVVLKTGNNVLIEDDGSDFSDDEIVTFDDMGEGDDI